jgi:proton-translocating NADH-quinone oxidoreductase chain L
MLTLVTAGNYVQLFMGWEGVGLASYLLISFWTTRTEANQGGLKAVLINRIGDVFFMFALALFWTLFKSFDFGVIFMLFPEFIEKEITLYDNQISFATVLALCLFLAASAKSAQLLLHTWLPDAMEGPTPVSSLLHSATMVTAGVFLIIRSSFIFSYTPNLSFIMACFGILTALISGLIGITQYDLKRIIAYSTISQLGFMVFACGLGYYTYALFHLVTHAFFKCLLFLCSGAILHALGDDQDIRRMGNLIRFMPVTFCTMFIGTLALTGFPMLSGYYSKDLILETVLDSSIFGTFVVSIASIAAFLTSAYSIRSLYFVFWRNSSPMTKHVVPFIEDAPPLMAFSMIILAICALFSGYLFIDIFTGPTGLLFWKGSINVPVGALIIEHEFENVSLKLLPTFAGFLGTVLGLLLYSSSNAYTQYLKGYFSYNLANQKFYFDQLYILLFGRFSTRFGYTQYKLLDRGILELFGPSGLTSFVKFLMSKFMPLHSGYLVHYLLFGLIFLFIFLFFIAYYLALDAIVLCLIINFLKDRK